MAALAAIKIYDLRVAAQQSLADFYSRQYGEISRITGNTYKMVLSLMKLNESGTTADLGVKQSIMNAKQTLMQNGVKPEYLTGVPLQKYSKEYIEQNVKPVMDRMAKQYAIDPGDVDGKNSLRNRAEMEVRYHGHLDNIDELKQKGVKLVIASTHADCSERCAPWQGRVYSLDGSSGVTPDGRRYVPLERATDVYYTTRAGKTYKNGLLGFNCRHYLVEYKPGYKFPDVSADEERQQYDITKRQRQLERNVLEWRKEALANKGVDNKRYSYARKKAIQWNRTYIAYSKAHNRAFYPSRVKIL